MQSYVIQRRGGGLFSIITSVLAHLHEADQRGLIPYVDLESLPNPYQEKKAVHGTHNVWEYYFQPVSALQRSEAFRDTAVISGSGFPKDYPDSLFEESLYGQMWAKYCRLNQISQGHVNSELDRLHPNSSTLGLHFRGQEQRTASRHPLPPTLRQMSKVVEHFLNVGSFDRILLATEAQQYVDYFHRRFPGLVVATSTFRLRYKNSYRFNDPPRAQHRYRLGLESLTDAFLLGSCGGLIGCNSNLTDGAAFIGRSNHSLSLVVNNGFNSANPILKKIKWYLRAGLPSSLGGFKGWASATEVRVGPKILD